MRRVMLLVVSVLMIVTMAISPAFAHDWDGDGWDEDGWNDDFEFSLEYECEIEDIDWDGDGFGDEFGFVVEYECELDD